jgi:hypothetical protein
MKIFNQKKGIVFILLLGLFFLFHQCEKEKNDQGQVLVVNQEGYSNINTGNCSDKINDFPIEELSNLEILGLNQMREEEKLAHDVYASLYDKYSIQIFGNISDSEQTHTDAVLLLLNRYALPDPALNLAQGDFTDSILHDLHDGLLSRANESEIEALRVGAAIEEIDILDLINLLDNIVDNQDIDYVFGNLLKGSRNHLRAFVRNLENRNIDYQPEYLDEELYNEIIQGDMEHGNNG